MFISAVRPEDQLLVWTARRNVDDLMLQSIRDLLKQSSLDWAYVFAAATSHGVVPLLAHHLEGLGKEVPPSVISQLRDENQQHTEHSLWLTGELLRLMAAMHEAGISCIPFKGPTLAIAAYGDLGLRQFTDLDVFIHRNDFGRVKDLLIKRGYRPVRNFSSAQEAALLRFDSASAFVNPQDVLLDVHWRFAPRYLSLALESEELWRRAEKVRINNHLLFTFSAEDLLLILCCHGFSHRWDRLVWACDVAALIQRRDDLNWDSLLEKAKRLGILRIVLGGLMLAGGMGATLPPHIVARLDREPAVRTFIQELSPQILGSKDGNFGSSESLLHQLSMRERARDKLRSLIHVILTPRDYDWMFASVPDSFAFLYYLIRPIRMLSGYWSRMVKTDYVRS